MYNENQVVRSSRSQLKDEQNVASLDIQKRKAWSKAFHSRSMFLSYYHSLQAQVCSTNWFQGCSESDFNFLWGPPNPTNTYFGHFLACRVPTREFYLWRSLSDTRRVKTMLSRHNLFRTVHVWFIFQGTENHLLTELNRITIVVLMLSPSSLIVFH